MALVGILLVAWWASHNERWWTVALTVCAACVFVPLAIWSFLNVPVSAQVLDIIQGGVYRLPMAMFLAFFLRRRREKLSPSSSASPPPSSEEE